MAITVPIVSEWQPKGVRKAIADFQKLETTGQKIGFGLKKAFLPAAAALGGLAAAAVPAINKASDLNENISKTEVIFGDAADAVKAFAETAAISIGQSQTAALDAAGTFGTFGKAAGLAGTDLASFTTDFITLASDLASFNNTSPEEAVQAIGAALRGEAEPMRRFGVLLNDATLKAEAMTLGIYDGNGALTDQQKILAAQSAIMKQTGDAQGDFARTSDGLANSQRTLSAQFDDFQATLGTALLPVIEAVMPALISMTTWASENTELILGIGIAVGSFASAIIAANIAMKAWTVITGITAALNAVLATSFSALWVATGIGIIVAIIAVVVTLQMKFDILGKAVDGLTWLFNYLWDKAKIVLAGIVEGINIMIEAWNKLPLVPDIPLIEAGFLKIEKAAESVGTKIEAQVEPFQLFTDSVAESTIETEISAAMLEQALIPAVEKVGVSFDTAKWELMAFYDQIDREDAFARFQDNLADVSEEITGLEPGSAEFEQNMRDAYNAVRDLSNELGYIPAELEKTLLYRIEIGDIAGAERLAGLISAGDTYRATASDELRFLGGASQSPSGIVNNVTVNAGMGTDGASVGRQIVEALNTYGASGGAQISSALVR